MTIEEMTVDELKARASEIAEERTREDADQDALEMELRSIKEQMEARKAAAREAEEVREKVAAGAGFVTEEIHTEEKPMSEMEIRNSKQYIDAYAEYIKTEDPTEVRSILTENASGTIAVPELVYDIVKTAWAREGIMANIKKSYIQGNLKVGFELSADGAVVHTEGAAAVSEESLVLGTVTLVPASIKKWISVSDEALDLRGEAFLRYIYDELTYRIAKKAADLVIAAIEAATTVNTATCPAVPTLKVTTIGVGTVAAAMAQLSDEANEPVVMMNKLTWGAFKAAQYANGYNVDPFEGRTVLFNDTIKAFSAATTGDTYMIVGDLQHGALANFPAGDEITIKVDENTLMTQDLVRVLGREYVAVGVVAPNAFVKVTK